ncbi:MAG TPA: ABC transporter permease, partial [Rectinemataceae bacterium]
RRVTKPQSGRKSGLSSLGATALALAASFAAALILLLIFAEDFPAALRYFFLSPLGNTYYLGNLLAASAPLMLGGLGITFAFGSRNFNLGGEGQIYSGALAATVLCLALPSPSGGLSIHPLVGQALAALAGAGAGACIGLFSGALKRFLMVDELISSFLVSAALSLGVDYLVTGPFQDPGSNFQTTLAIAQSLRLPRLLPPSQLSTSLGLSVAVCIAAKFFMERTRCGYELKVYGNSGEFAAYIGIDTGLYTLLPMGISGALHGLAGAVMILGTYYKVMKGFSAGVGWTAIAVALIARNKPLAVIPAALFFAYLDAGAKSVMIGSNVSSEIVAVIQSVIFFLVTASVLESRRAGSRRKKPGGSA